MATCPLNPASTPSRFQIGSGPFLLPKPAQNHGIDWNPGPREGTEQAA
jgi:hypothetical protein